MSKGWRFESNRHSLAAHGIKTNPKYAYMGMTHTARSMDWWNKKKYWVYALDDFEEDEIDIDSELKVAERVRSNWKEMWKTNDIDLNYLKKSMNELSRRKVNFDIDVANEPRMTIIFHRSESNYGAGSGGYGGARVFWLPYSYPDRDRFEVHPSMGVDSARILAHELSHAYGFDVEFIDTWNDAVAFKTLIEMGISTKSMAYELNSNALRILCNRHKKQKKKYYLEPLHLMRYLYRTFGESVMSGYMMSALRYSEEVQRFNGIMREEITGKFGRGGNK